MTAHEDRAVRVLPPHRWNDGRAVWEGFYWLIQAGGQRASAWVDSGPMLGTEFADSVEAAMCYAVSDTSARDAVVKVHVAADRQRDCWTAAEAWRRKAGGICGALYVREIVGPRCVPGFEPPEVWTIELAFLVEVM